MTKYLALESSCDESAVAFLCDEERRPEERIFSQIENHASFGGVVPELAVREHLRALPDLLRDLSRTRSFSSIDVLAVTCGPGLAGCLAMGLSAAHALAIQLGRPLYGVNHLRAHALSVFMDPWCRRESLEAYLPHLGLLVSGGNTLLFQIDEGWRFRVIGGTVDDAAGEGFDKAAKLLGLPYPGGREIERLAAGGDPGAFSFPRAFRPEDLRFSFSGLKTALRYFLEKLGPEAVARDLSSICASYQAALLESLLEKFFYAAKMFGPKSLGISGGVSQNGRLRRLAQDFADLRGLPLLLARPEVCGDNASMVAFAAAVDAKGLRPADAFLPNLRLDGTVG